MNIFTFMINKTYNVPIFIPHIAYYRKGSAVVRALASQQCGQDSNLGVEAMCEFSLSFVLSLAPRGFPFSSKTNIFKLKFDQESGRGRTT